MALQTIQVADKPTLDELKASIDNATYGLQALKTLLDNTAQGSSVDEVEGLLKNSTYGLSALNTDTDSILSKLNDSNYGLSAIKSALGSCASASDVNVSNNNLRLVNGVEIVKSRTADIVNVVGSGRLYNAIISGYGYDCDQSIKVIIDGNTLLNLTVQIEGSSGGNRGWYITGLQSKQFLIEGYGSNGKIRNPQMGDNDGQYSNCYIYKNNVNLSFQESQIINKMWGYSSKSDAKLDAIFIPNFIKFEKSLRVIVTNNSTYDYSMNGYCAYDLDD